MGSILATLQLCVVLLAAVSSSPGDELPFGDDDSSRCIRYHRPGKLLFYKDTAVFPIGISVPAGLVQRDVPAKSRGLAPFVGSSKGGDTSQYSFGPLDEERYRAFYARHRFARTWKKGGWDALRHAEILAAGAVPLFRGLAEAPPLVLPYLPAEQLLRAERELLPMARGPAYARAYNATVRSLLGHARQCLTSESMAARVLRTLGLWPTRRPLRLLYVACGWGFTSMDDGWQGPVSIGLFLGLHELLQGRPGSRIVDAPLIKGDFLAEHTHRSHLWYTFEREEGCRFKEENLRRLMYGYGFSYARRIPREAMASAAEREGVVAAIRRREFDAVIYGKVGPTQGCDPLPYMQEVQEAGYPPQRVALIYGGDFGLSNKNVSTHMRLMGEFGTIFVREIDAPVDSRFAWRPESVLPKACFMQGAWRSFFKLWDMRLRCWGCSDIDEAVVEALWPSLRAAEAMDEGPWQSEPCWSGLALLALPLLARGPAALGQRCDFAGRQLAALRARLAGVPGAEEDFLEAFGVRPAEVHAAFCRACGGEAAEAAGAVGALCAAALRGPTAALFSPDFDAGPARRPLAELRSTLALRERLAGA